MSKEPTKRTVITKEIRLLVMGLYNHCENYSHRKIAEIIGISPSSVDKIISEQTYVNTKERNKRRIENRKQSLKKSMQDNPERFATRTIEKLQYAPPPEPDALTVAERTLGHRLERGKLANYLDGRPETLNTIMQATNRIRKRTGMDQLDKNPAWRV